MKREIQTLCGLLSEAGITTDRTFAAQAEAFTAFFLETAQTLNLTAIKDPHEMMLKHYFDSLYPLQYGYFAPGASVIDVGCGGGFPSVPLKLARPDLKVVQLDSLQKRLTFLDNAAAKLGLREIRTVHARAEDAGREDALRDHFDIAVSRAVAPLDLLCELCLPFVRPGGVMLAYKGGACEEELEAAQPAIRALRAAVLRVHSYELPEQAGARTLIVLQKQDQTPEAYPRSAKNMSKGAIK